MKQGAISVMSVICVSAAYCCVFPKYLQGTTWYKNSRGSTRTVIYFRGNIMENQEQNTELNYIMDEWENNCVQMVDQNKFIVSHYNDTYTCILFIKRSESVFQLKVSKTSAEYSKLLCDDESLHFDKWPLVSLEKSETEFTICPFSGGYNMKIRDSSQTDHPCNFMDLPMRFESECHTGEGLTFDFRTNNCIGDLPMNQVQKAFCVTSWRQGGDVLTIIRNPDTGKLWCLRIPARRTFDGKTVMILYIDLTCSEEQNILFFTLELEFVSQNSLCIDEHNGCHRLPCTNYFVSQCLKSCGKCDPNVYPTTCDYPRKLRGQWYINDGLGSTVVNISGSKLYYKRVGSFSCVSFPGSPSSRKNKQFTTVSFFNNGCRPRYTCVSFKRMNSNVFGFALSQSKIWPLQRGHDEVWSKICDSNNFYGDPKPVGDTFRTYNDVFKPMITNPSSVIRKQCPLHSSYVYNTTFHSGGTCTGRLYKLCQNPSTIRIEYNNCPFIDQKVQTYTCLGLLDSKYWESIILLQDTIEFRNTSCLILSDIEPGRILLLPSGECDQFTWTYVNVGLRHATLDMLVTPEMHSCRSAHTTRVTATERTDISTAQTIQSLQDGFISDRLTDIHESEGKQSAATTHRHRHQNKADITTTPSLPYKVVQTDVADKVFTSKVSSSSNILSSTFLLYIVSVFLLLLTYFP